MRNKESLIQHVREQFFCADPVKYMPVLRQIRVSKPTGMVRSYVIGMYTNESNVHICQICKEPVPFVEVVEIANLGLELPQMHLCLCKNCASKYKAIRDNHKEEYRRQVQQAIISMDLENADEEYEIGLSNDISIAFTQTHLAEIQTLLMLIDKYGLPDVENSDIEKMINSYGSLGNMPGREDDNTTKKMSNGTKKKISDIGERVKHKIYGFGTVEECFGDRISILFDDGKEKDFDLKVCVQAGSLTLIEGRMILNDNRRIQKNPR